MASPIKKKKTLRNVQIENAVTRTLCESFNEFLMVKELEGLRERTLADHKNHFRYFNEYLERTNTKVSYLHEITPQICRGYIAFMKNEKRKWDTHEHLSDADPAQGLSPATINIRIRTIKAQFNFYVSEGFIELNPWDAVPLQKVDNEILNVFDKKELRKLLAAPNQRSYVGYRDYVLMLALLDTGCRISEILAVDETDVDFSRSVILIAGSSSKTRNYRYVPISTTTAGAIKKLIEQNSILRERECAVFITVSGNRLSGADVRRFLTQYGKKAGITRVRCSPHTFRHTFATHYILNGGDPFTLQKILGHSSIDMTRRYIDANIEDLKNQHAKFSPLNAAWDAAGIKRLR